MLSKPSNRGVEKSTCQNASNRLEIDVCKMHRFSFSFLYAIVQSIAFAWKFQNGFEAPSFEFPGNCLCRQLHNLSCGILQESLRVLTGNDITSKFRSVINCMLYSKCSNRNMNKIMTTMMIRPLDDPYDVLKLWSQICDRSVWGCVGVGDGRFR